MKIAYLVLTHAMPDHLGRLIAALTDDDTDFFVHVDRKTAIEPFLEHRRPNVHFLEQRLPIYWGQWQMVEATLRLMRTALASGTDHDYLVLLSGSCYPIRSRRYIQGLLAEDPTAEHISSVRMPNAEVAKLLGRLDRFYRRSDQSRLESLRRLVAGQPVRHRAGRFPSRRWLLARDWQPELGPLIPHGGSSWWALTGAACRHIDAFVAREPRAVRFFENTRSPDEMFFQTILANSDFAPKVRRSLTYVAWSRDHKHPELIGEPQLTRFAQPGPLIVSDTYGSGELCFARKFPDDGGRTTALVDEMIREREGGMPIGPSAA